MKKSLLIIFVKNLVLGKVKTRLANSIGSQKALDVYKYLVESLEKEVNSLSCDKHVYFSEFIDQDYWVEEEKYIQKGNDIGERMSNAFENSFKQGYEKVVLIGSDIPDLSSKIIKKAFVMLENYESVIGPAKDGGYYLIGLKKMNELVFDNIDWSTDKVLNQTLSKFENYSLVDELNDIDTLDDLKDASFSSQFL